MKKMTRNEAIDKLKNNTADPKAFLESLEALGLVQFEPEPKPLLKRAEEYLKLCDQNVPDVEKRSKYHLLLREFVELFQVDQDKILHSIFKEHRPIGTFGMNRFECYRINNLKIILESQGYTIIRKPS